jgi:hypothetical protein
MRARRLKPIWVAVAALAGCGEPDPGYFPLDAGRRWEFAINIHTMAGPKQQKLIIENLGRRWIDGEEVTQRRVGTGNSYFFRADDTGVTLVAESTDGNATRRLDVPRTVIGYPASTGTSWTGTTRTVVLEKITPPEGSLTRIEETLDMRYVIEATDDVVTVPAGRFEGCLRIKGTATSSRNIGFYIGSTDIRVESTDWYAPGVGLIKAERNESTSEPTFPQGGYTLELIARAP